MLNGTRRLVQVAKRGFVYLASTTIDVRAAAAQAAAAATKDPAAARYVREVESYSSSLVGAVQARPQLESAWFQNFNLMKRIMLST